MYLYTVNAFPYGALQGHAGQGAGVRAGLALGGAHPLHHQRRRRAGRCLRRRTSRRRSRPRRSASSRASPADDVVASYTDHVLRVVAHLVALEANTGAPCSSALEPEPFCFLETTDETVEYFTKHLYSGAAAEKLAKLAHTPDLGGARARCAGISASSTTSATRRSNTRTSPSRCRSWSMPASRSSSCRKPPPCTFRK